MFCNTKYPTWYSYYNKFLVWDVFMKKIGNVYTKNVLPIKQQS